MRERSLWYRRCLGRSHGRSGRFFIRADVSADLRTVRKSEGRKCQVHYGDRWSHDKVVQSADGVRLHDRRAGQSLRPPEVGWALGRAAVQRRVAAADLPSILKHHANSGAAGRAQRGGVDRSLMQDCGLGRPRSAPAPARHRWRRRGGGPMTTTRERTLLVLSAPPRSLAIASGAIGALVHGRQAPMSTHADSPVVVVAADPNERGPHE